MVKSVFHLPLVLMDEFGTPNILNVCALRIPSGMERIASLVEMDKFTLEIWVVAVPMEPSLMAVNVSRFLFRNVNPSPTLNGTVPNALVFPDILFKACPAFVLVLKTMDIAMSATLSRTLNGSMEFANAIKDIIKT